MEPRKIPSISELLDALKPSLKVLEICLSHSWGGLEQVAANDAVELAQLGVSMRVMVLEGSPIHEYLAKKPEVKVISLDYRPRDFLDFKLKGEIEKLLLEGVNLIHCHQTSLLGSVVPWVWFKPDVSVFASRHIMNNHNKNNLFHRAIYGRLDALIVMSQTLKENVMDTHPLKERQVRVVNLGLDFDRFDPKKIKSDTQREKWEADKDAIVIGLVGRIDPAKGQGTFLKAAAGLLRNWNQPEKIKFVIVGEETLGRASTHLEELKEMVRQFQISEHVVFAGYQENIPEVMKAFDIFVMPSRQEAFGLVAIEAMAMECPIIISSGGSAAEIIGQEEYGVLIRPDDAFDLQRQLRWMLENPEARKEMGRRGREHVKKHYDKLVRLQLTLSLYERSLRRRGLSHY